MDLPWRVGTRSQYVKMMLCSMFEAHSAIGDGVFVSPTLAEPRLGSQPDSNGWKGFCQCRDPRVIARVMPRDAVVSAATTDCGFA